MRQRTRSPNEIERPLTQHLIGDRNITRAGIAGLRHVHRCSVKRSTLFRKALSHALDGALDGASVLTPEAFELPASGLLGYLTEARWPPGPLTGVGLLVGCSRPAPGRLIDAKPQQRA